MTETKLEEVDNTGYAGVSHLYYKNQKTTLCGITMKKVPKVLDPNKKHCPECDALYELRKQLG